MHQVRKERESCLTSLDFNAFGGAMNGTEEIESSTTSQAEMQERSSFLNDWVPKLALLPENNDEWKIGAWRSSAGVCRIAEGRGRGGITGRKKGLSATVGGESSFEKLDMRAAEVLERSIQALETCNSLASCALEMPTDSRLWDESSWEVEQHNQEDQRSRDSDVGGLVSCSKELGTVKDCRGRDHTLDTRRVLQEIVNSGDCSVRLSSPPKTLEDDSDTTVANFFGENTTEDDQVESVAYARVKSLNETSRKNAVDVGHELPRAQPILSNNIRSHDSSESASGCCRTATNSESFQKISTKRTDGEGGASGNKRTDFESGARATMDRLNRTDLAELSREMLPPKAQGSGSLELLTRLKEERRRKGILVASERRRLGSLKKTYVARKPAHSKQNKVISPSKSPKWKGLSTALSIVRLMCHGAGEAGVVNAQTTPVLIISGKCVFRTTAPLDTPRPCSALQKRRSSALRGSNRDIGGAPPTTSADDATEKVRRATSHAQLTDQPLLPPLISTGQPSRNKCHSTCASVKHWPVTMPELDGWISEIVNVWLDKDEHVAAVANSSCTHSSVTMGTPVLPSAMDLSCKEKQGVFRSLQAEKVIDHPVQFSNPLPTLLTELRKPVDAPKKKQSELDARIDQAQTVHDLSQILEPISQATLTSVKWVGEDMKRSPMSVIQEFGRDDDVQDFQRQIHVLEQEIEDLKSSLCKQERAKLFPRLQALKM